LNAFRDDVRKAIELARQRHLDAEQKRRRTDQIAGLTSDERVTMQMIVDGKAQA
jgi:hypothetical protein